MKKICILTSVHSPFDIRIFYKEAKTLSNTGYDITLISQHDKNETVDGIKIIALLKPRNRFFRIFVTTWKIFKLALKQKASIYHFHDPELILVGLLLKFFTGAKVIYDVHEDVAKQILSKYWIPKISRKLVANIFDKYEKWAAKKMDYIITATPDIKNNFKQNKIIDIKNYPIISSFQKIKKENFHSKKYTELIYVGGLSKERGIKKIIQSLKYINPKYNLKLKIIGNFSNKKFEEEIKRMAEWKKINFLGFLPQKQAYQYMCNADLGLVCIQPLPRYVVSLPVKMFEYMMAGLPIIASNFPLWRKIIEENNCGICVNPLKLKEIAKTIEYLIEHPEETKKMKKNGRKAILKKYNWENESKKLIKIYKNLTN